jgi:hypothetical protein
LKRRRRTTTTTTTLLRLEKPTRGKLWRGGRERNKVWAKGGGGGSVGGENLITSEKRKAA